MQAQRRLQLHPVSHFGYERWLNSGQSPKFSLAYWTVPASSRLGGCMQGCSWCVQRHTRQECSRYDIGKSDDWPAVDESQTRFSSTLLLQSVHPRIALVPQINGSSGVPDAVEAGANNCSSLRGLL